MSKIRLLKDDVINKIAAGEVVERPASVVKELVENSLDAGATRIEVQIDDGGKKRITVIDDGKGMDREDAVLALKRHATSKIQTADDLFKIATMGFRGEALASIAAVSKLTLQTRKNDDEDGVRVSVDGGEILDQQPLSSAIGTTISVEELFYNIPARASFLKSKQAEAAQITELLQAFALSNPAISFRLLHNNKQVFFVEQIHSEKTRNLAAVRDRLKAIIGGEVSDNLIEISKSSKYGKATGLISPPGLDRGTTRQIFTFVNGRWVKDRNLRFALTRGYHSHLLKGRYPVVALFLEMDPSLVDVNVHPAKTEVRFQYASEVQSLVALAIREGLRQGAWASDNSKPSSPSDSDNVMHSPFSSGELPAAMQSKYVPQAPRRHAKFSGADLMTTSEPGFSSTRKAASLRQDNAVETRILRHAERSEESRTDPSALCQDGGFKITSQETIPWYELTYIGAFAKCYLLFEHKERLLVVDQHAFHERILYERLLKDRALLGGAQKLLVIDTVSLSATQQEAVDSHSDRLTELGFQLRSLPDGNVEVLALPQLLQNRDPQDLLQAVAEDLIASGNTDAEGLMQNLLATIACHSAVRSGEELGENELRFLLNEALTVDFYHNCPHGRPVFKWWKLRQVAAWFDR